MVGWGHYQNYDHHITTRTPLDGNCLFYAVIRGMGNENPAIGDIATLREIVADFLQHRPDIMEAHNPIRDLRLFLTHIIVIK